MRSASPVRQCQWVDQCPEEQYGAKDLYLREVKFIVCQRKRDTQAALFYTGKGTFAGQWD